MTKQTKIHKFKIHEASDEALSNLQHHIRVRTEKLNQSQGHIQQLVRGCVNTDMLMAEGTLKFHHDNLDEIKNKIAEHHKLNNELFKDVQLLEWVFTTIAKNEGK